MPSATVTCSKCGAKILATTASRTGGLCLPCQQGRSKTVEPPPSVTVTRRFPARLSPFSRLRQISLWGDYGDVLISGFTSRDVSTGQLRLHRGGPFVPPISFPWDATSGHALVVTEAFRRALEGAGAGPLIFRPAIKDHITPVTFDWAHWDRTLDVPPMRPPGGEPETFLSSQPHSPTIAAAMPELWEMLPPVLPCKVKKETAAANLDSRPLFFPVPDAIYHGLFRDHETWSCFIADRSTREWLEELAGDWVRFEPLWAGSD